MIPFYLFIKLSFLFFKLPLIIYHFLKCICNFINVGSITFIVNLLHLCLSFLLVFKILTYFRWSRYFPQSFLLGNSELFPETNIIFQQNWAFSCDLIKEFWRIAKKISPRVWFSVSLDYFSAFIEAQQSTTLNCFFITNEFGMRTAQRALHNPEGKVEILSSLLR